jgi:hypothetical protein
MLTEAVIILANMRGGYANVGPTVHTLFRMSRRPAQEVERSPITEVDSAQSILKRLESSR